MMSEHWTDRLSDYLDGDIAPGEATRLEAHLSGCAACLAALDDLRALQVRTAALEDQPPPNDLWPAILQRIGQPEAEVLPIRPPVSRKRRFSFSIVQLAAAATILVSLSSGAVWLLTRPDPAAAPAQLGSGSGAPVMDEATPRPAQLVASTQANYEDAIRELERELMSRRSQLDSTTIAVVERNLGIIDAAIADARSALENDPSNAYLYQHLDNTLMRKIDLLRRAAAMRSAAT